MAKEKKFEEIFKEIEEDIRKLEEGELSIDESIELHKKTTNKIEQAKKILSGLKGRIEEIKT